MRGGKVLLCPCPWHRWGWEEFISSSMAVASGWFHWPSQLVRAPPGCWEGVGGTEPCIGLQVGCGHCPILTFWVLMSADDRGPQDSSKNHYHSTQKPLELEWEGPGMGEFWEAEKGQP